MKLNSKSVARLLGIGAVALCACGSALAQSPEAPVPDYAALIGVPLSKADVTRSRLGRSSASDVQRRIGAAGIRRTAAERAASEGLNRALAQMPETREQAMRQAAVRGDGVVQISLEELQPMYAMPNEGGGFSAAHVPLESVVRQQGGE